MSDWLRTLLDLLFPPRNSEVIVRTTSYDELAALVSPVTLPDGTIALLPYRNKVVQAFIREAKFRANKTAWTMLGRVLAEYIQEYLADAALIGSTRYVLQPVPLANERLREREYNQVEEIAVAAAAILGLPLAAGVIRTRNTLPQTSLERARRLTNLVDAFAATELTDATYLLIDDVATTGATLSAVRSVLPPDTVSIALAH